MDKGSGGVRIFCLFFFPLSFFLFTKKMQHIRGSFWEFLGSDSSDNFVKFGVETVKSGVLHKDCVNGNGNCLAIVLLEHAFLSAEPQACMALLCQFFEMKPCLRKVWAVLPNLTRFNYHFFQFCISMDYLWTDSFAVQQWWCTMPMVIRNNWSPCRVAWILAVVQ